MKGYLLLIAYFFSLRTLVAQNSPVATNDTVTFNKNNVTTLFILANDYDTDGDPLSLSVTTLPNHGQVLVNTNNIQYTPDFNYSGTDSFQYTICDITSLCSTANVYLFITGNNNKPIAVDDFYTFPANVSTTLPVLSNDSDPDGDTLSLAILNPPLHGNASIINGQILFLPTPNYFGSDSFAYIICDANLLCDTAMVYLTIVGNNTKPNATNDSYIFGDTLIATTLNLLSNDLDAEGDSLFLTELIDLDSLNNLGSLFFTSNGIVAFTRTSLACGSETFQYVVCDYAACDTALITITIECPDDIFQTQGFSPDGDGLNDKLVFPGLEHFSPAALKVYNRYGTLVYSSDEYVNDWDGTFKENQVPDGTYFYVLELADKRRYNQYLIIHR